MNIGLNTLNLSYLRQLHWSVYIMYVDHKNLRELSGSCATVSQLGRSRPPKMAACHPSWRTTLRAPRVFLRARSFSCLTTGLLPVECEHAQIGRGPVMR